MFMNKRLFLISLTAIALLCSTVGEAYNHDGKHSGRHSYRKRYQQPRDYYPLLPQYQHSPVHESVAGGVLGSVLGYEIAKDNTVTSKLDATNDSYLGRGFSKKR